MDEPSDPDKVRGDEILKSQGSILNSQLVLTIIQEYNSVFHTGALPGH